MGGGGSGKASLLYTCENVDKAPYINVGKDNIKVSYITESARYIGSLLHNVNNYVTVILIQRSLCLDFHDVPVSLIPYLHFKNYLDCDLDCDLDRVFTRNKISRSRSQSRLQSRCFCSL